MKKEQEIAKQIDKCIAHLNETIDYRTDIDLERDGRLILGGIILGMQWVLEDGKKLNYDYWKRSGITDPNIVSLGLALAHNFVKKRKQL